ncbi:MAG: histidinol-phosphate aminotransferase family protein [Phycisphaerales bacterium]|nr:histidinol-phosphate aminotransferase family protein [Planctomycetota bacterium]MCH8507845.1 histidinol-phosphate aminotransferase family protein [Phycisphaerales bacterium]
MSGPGWIKASLRGVRAYAPPVRTAPDEMYLDLNEGAPLAPDGWLAAVAAGVGMDAARRYPDASRLEGMLADRLGVAPERVLVTNGGDDAIDRVCRACLGPGDEIVAPSPSFEMIARSAELVGGRVVRTPWMGGAFPVNAVLGAVTERTRLVAVVSPNNPTGGVITRSELEQLSDALPGVLLMVDLAYTEFADDDLTAPALALLNAVIVRTFSKAYGLAGLRVGYAAGGQETIDALRAAGGPFACSAVSLAAAEAALGLPEVVLAERVERVRAERVAIAALLSSHGCAVLSSEANFVLARFGDAGCVWGALGERGVRVKRFASPELADWLRIGCPGDAAGLERLISALGEVVRERGRLEVGPPRKGASA